MQSDNATPDKTMSQTTLYHETTEGEHATAKEDARKSRNKRKAEEVTGAPSAVPSGKKEREGVEEEAPKEQPPREKAEEGGGVEEVDEPEGHRDAIVFECYPDTKVVISKKELAELCKDGHVLELLLFGGGGFAKTACIKDLCVNFKISADEFNTIRRCLQAARNGELLRMERTNVECMKFNALKLGGFKSVDDYRPAHKYPKGIIGIPKLHYDHPEDCAWEVGVVVPLPACAPDLACCMYVPELHYSYGCVCRWWGL